MRGTGAFKMLTRSKSFIQLLHIKHSVIFTSSHSHLTTRKNQRVTETTMSSMTVRNMSLKKGSTLAVIGIPDVNCSRFNLNVGNSDSELALHVDCRFNYGPDRKTVVCNSLSGGKWGEDHKGKDFPFAEGKLFEVKIHLAGNEFEITLPNGSLMQFPNRLGADKYKYLKFADGVRIQGIKIM